MGKSSEQLKHIERISRRTRHHQLQLTNMSEEKLRRNLNNLKNQYEQVCIRSKTNVDLEQERKKLLDVTVKQIANARQRHSLSMYSTHNEPTGIQKSPQINGNLRNRSSLPIEQPSTGKSCQFFSHNCQLYPCQPVYQYTSFMKKEHDQTLQERNPSNENSDMDSSLANLQDLFTQLREKKYRPDRRQLAVTMQNQYRLAQRHQFVKRTKTSLDEQSRLLKEKLTEKKNFDYGKIHQYDFRKAIQHHLRISAKFCA